MSIRRDPVYLSNDVWRVCWLLAKAAPKPAPKGHEEARSIPTADEIADQKLRKILMAEHPQLFDHLKQVAKLEADLIKTL